MDVKRCVMVYTFSKFISKIPSIIGCFAIRFIQFLDMLGSMAGVSLTERTWLPLNGEGHEGCKTHITINLNTNAALEGPPHLVS